jgi:hypothetical protein
LNFRYTQRAIFSIRAEISTPRKNTPRLDPSGNC